MFAVNSRCRLACIMSWGKNVQGDTIYNGAHMLNDDLLYMIDAVVFVLFVIR